MRALIDSSSEVVLDCGQILLYAQPLSLVSQVGTVISKENWINPIYHLIWLHAALLQFYILYNQFGIVLTGLIRG